ncbi:hypothetical protein P885DRAFT_62434 [Corynascus similis CBS 632.67]
MKLFTSLLLGLTAAVSAVDVQYYTGEGCGGDLVEERTLDCFSNRLPASPIIRGINLLYSNGITTEFYESSDCTGAAWFVDDGTGGCVTDSQAVTNCINVIC